MKVKIFSSFCFRRWSQSDRNPVLGSLGDAWPVTLPRVPWAVVERSRFRVWALVTQAHDEAPTVLRFGGSRPLSTSCTQEKPLRVPGRLRIATENGKAQGTEKRVHESLYLLRSQARVKAPTPWAVCSLCEPARRPALKKGGVRPYNDGEAHVH